MQHARFPVDDHVLHTTLAAAHAALTPSEVRIIASIAAGA
jgi:hypothetical protein